MRFLSCFVVGVVTLFSVNSFSQQNQSQPPKGVVIDQKETFTPVGHSTQKKPAGKTENCVQYDQGSYPQELVSACVDKMKSSERKALQREWSAYKGCVNEGLARAQAEKKPGYDCTLLGQSYHFLSGIVVVEKTEFLAGKKDQESVSPLGEIRDCIQFYQNGKPAKLKSACLRKRNVADQNRIREEWHGYQRCINQGIRTAQATHQPTYTCSFRGSVYEFFSGELKTTQEVKEE